MNLVCVVGQSFTYILCAERGGQHADLVMEQTRVNKILVRDSRVRPGCSTTTSQRPY